MYAFDISRPSTIADAVSALSGEAQALGGGQTLIPTLKQRLADPGNLVSLTGIADMQGVSSSGGTVTIGGATCHADVAAGASAYPALAALAGNIGDPAVRNRGTIGGSVANNDPAADYPAACLGLGATIVTNSREIAADDFFTDMFETALAEDEIITAIRFPIPQKAGYEKFPNPASRYAMAGVFAAETAGGARVAVTGAGASGVFRHAAAEAALSGGFTADALAGMSTDADNMLTDIHASAAYRANLVNVMAKRAVAKAG